MNGTAETKKADTYPCHHMLVASSFRGSPPTLALAIYLRNDTPILSTLPIHSSLAYPQEIINEKKVPLIMCVSNIHGAF